MSTGAMSGLFAALIDDASLFPPGNLPMPTAVAEHRGHRSGGYAQLVNRFLCPASRLRELRSALADDDAFDVGVILDAGIEGLDAALGTIAQDPRLRLTAIEVPIRPDADPAAAAHENVHALAALPSQAAAFVELPRVRGWRDALSLVAARGHGAKLRTGGLVADAFPSEVDVAEFIRACVMEHAQFKCTAGLHHAARHRDDRTGFEHHGFLNMLLATHAAIGGASVDEIAEILAERDPGELVERALDIPPAPTPPARRHFVGFGTCSVHEPIDHLTGLGLIEKQDPWTGSTATDAVARSQVAAADVAGGSAKTISLVIGSEGSG
jgi:hypothetical protein